MVSIPTVSQFCGCCDLKVANTLVASLRIILDTFVILYCVFALFFMAEIDSNVESDNEIEYSSSKSHAWEIFITCEDNVFL